LESKLTVKEFLFDGFYHASWGNYGVHGRNYYVQMQEVQYDVHTRYIDTIINKYMLCINA